VDLLVVRFVARVTGAALLHVCRSIARNVCVVRESASKLRLVAIALASPGVLLVLLTILSVRLLIIQYLNILIIIIIISFLALRLETSHRHPRQPAVLPLIRVAAWARRSIYVVVCARSLTCCQVAGRTQRR